jgi:hypothetical protein
MKKLFFILSLLGVGFTSTFAQNIETKKDNYPYWTISKEVMRMQFKNVKQVPATITTGNSSWIYAKGLQQHHAKYYTTNTGRVVMTGTPVWVISKGVATLRR